MVDSSFGGLFQPINPYQSNGITQSRMPDLSQGFIPSNNNSGLGHGAPNAPAAYNPQQSAGSSIQALQGLGSIGQGIAGAAQSDTAKSIYNGISGFFGGGSGSSGTGFGGLDLSSLGGSSDAADAAGSSGGILSSIGDAASSIASMFVNRGGAIPSYASGGNIENAPWYVRREAFQPHNSGMFNPNAGAGRTDNINATVPSGAYVVPADVVSGLGEGNSMMGANILHKMFTSAPYGEGIPKMGHGANLPKPPHVGHFAEGGEIGKPTQIVAAGGEFLIHPNDIIHKFGSLEHGHKVLDAWVVHERKKTAKTLSKLPPPKKN